MSGSDERRKAAAILAFLSDNHKVIADEELSTRLAEAQDHAHEMTKRAATRRLRDIDVAILAHQHVHTYMLHYIIRLLTVDEGPQPDPMDA